ncbi:MAG: malate synthase A [Cellulomonadaceae bacterium]
MTTIDLSPPSTTTRTPARADTPSAGLTPDPRTSRSHLPVAERVTVHARVPGSAEILTPEALVFLGELHQRFAGTRADLLAARLTRRRALENGARLDFLAETHDVREDPSWRVPPPAPGLEDRRVEITGPTDRKMTINAMNSGAKVWLADLEDANTPHLENVIDGQVNLRDAVRRQIDFRSPEGKEYALRDGELATIVVRPRGWHLTEKHLRFDGLPMSGSLVDFGLHLFHNAQALIDSGAGPYFYLPKLESHLEARLWNDVFCYAQDALGLERGTIRATVLIETITAAFEMEEILYELREHSSGLNAGRWDYIFSLIKNFRNDPRFILPDRADVAMTVPFMSAYAELLVRTCHRRGAHAIGGMSAFIPAKDPVRNAEVDTKVRSDKQREADAGFDGSWVAHPGMVEAVTEVFDGRLGFMPHQISRTREDVQVGATELLDVGSTPGAVTRAGLQTNVAVSLRYLEAWLSGRGAVAIYGLMEDAATAEISRSQVWQWIRHGVCLEDGTPVTAELVHQMLDAERDALVREAEESGDQARRERIDQAAVIFAEAALGEEYPTFLTIAAYATRVP